MSTLKTVVIGPRTIEIPDRWTVRQLGGKGGLCKVVTGGTPSTKVAEYWNGDIHWIIPTDITNSKGVYISRSERKITEEGLNSSSADLVPPGSILLTTRATIGEACINTVPMATNQGFKSLICRNEAHNLFVYYMLQREKKRLASLGGGSTFPEVSKTDIKYFEILTPPLVEQKRIAEILSTVDKAIQQTDKVIERAQWLKRGLTQDLLTKGIGRTEFKKVQVGPRSFGIPVSWCVKELAEISRVIMGQSPPGDSYNECKLGVPFFQGKADFGDMHPVVSQWTTEPSKMVSKGDVLISVRAPVGAMNMADIECCIGRGLAGLRARDDTDETFLYYLLIYQSRFLKSYAQGSTFESINKDVLTHLELPVPPYLEQKRIAEILSTTDQYIQNEREYCTSLQELKKGLMQDLLTGKVRVVDTATGMQGETIESE